MHNTLNELQHRMVQVSRLFDLFAQLHEVLEEHQELIGFIVASFDHCATNPTLKAVTNLLDAKTFQKDRSYVYSRGRVLRAHKVLHEAKADLVPVLQALGILDGYCSIARLYKEYNTNAALFSFPTFINSQEPQIQYDNAWIPVLSPTNVVNNNVYCGWGEYPSKLVITGPNGCGKSTFLKMIGQMVILAQSWGIAPAQSATQTIFAGLRTGLDPREDLQQGISTFMAEKKRMNELSVFINGSSANSHHLVLIDEPYRGTVDAESARRIYAFGSDIANIPCIVGIATHVQKPIELAHNFPENFVNYHVAINEPEPGVFERTFKLKIGPAMWWFEDAERRARFVDWIGEAQES